MCAAFSCPKRRLLNQLLLWLHLLYLHSCSGLGQNCFQPKSMPKLLVSDRLSPAQHMMLHVRWKQWQRKCSDDSETANWLNTNTKPCPKCQNQVEKNGGCNLVVCRCGQVQLFLESDTGFPTKHRSISLCLPNIYVAEADALTHSGAAAVGVSYSHARLCFHVVNVLRVFVQNHCRDLCGHECHGMPLKHWHCLAVAVRLGH